MTNESHIARPILPLGWRWSRLSWLFNATGSGTTPDQSDIVDPDATTIPWVTTGELRERRIDRTQKAIRPEALGAYSALKLHPAGSLAIAMYGATIGRMALLDVEATTNQACCVLSEPVGVTAEYAQYSLLANRAELILDASGGGQPNINQDKVRSFRIPVPPLDEQRAIANYLDCETARIDTLIAEQQQLVGLLQERRRSVADELLSRAAAMCPLKRITADITVGIVVNPATWYVDSGVPALRGLNVRPGYIKSTDLVYLSAEGDAHHEKSRLRTGDVVVVRTGQAGAAAVVPPDLDESNAIDLLIIRPGPEVDPDFLAAYLNAPSTKTRITEGSVGAIQGHFNVAALRELSFPVLDIAQQRRIAACLDEQTTKIDTLIAETERFIELSRERRSALITAAVTGQIDVRAEVA